MCNMHARLAGPTVQHLEFCDCGSQSYSAITRDLSLWNMEATKLHGPVVQRNTDKLQNRGMS